MCRVTMEHTRCLRIPSVQLYRRLGTTAVEHYYLRRLIRWAGHVPHAHGPASTAAAYRFRRESPVSRASANDVGAHLEGDNDQV